MSEAQSISRFPSFRSAGSNDDQRYTEGFHPQVRPRITDQDKLGECSNCLQTSETGRYPDFDLHARISCGTCVGDVASDAKPRAACLLYHG